MCWTWRFVVRCMSLWDSHGDPHRLMLLLARAGELPYGLPFSFLELENPPETGKATFRGLVKWYRHKGRMWEILLQAFERVWVHFTTSGKIIRSLQLLQEQRGDYQRGGIFSRSYDEGGPITPSWVGHYGVRGKPTRILCYRDGSPLFRPLPLVVHLEGVLFTRIPKDHYKIRENFRIGDFDGMGVFPEKATYLDQIWLWQTERQQYEDWVIRERVERRARILAGKWETPEELVEVRKRSLQPPHYLSIAEKKQRKKQKKQRKTALQVRQEEKRADIEIKRISRRSKDGYCR